MVDLEGQDHGPSSSSVGDNDDDFIVYSKENKVLLLMLKCSGNNARWFKKEGMKFLEDILCEVETDNATVAMECTEEVFLAKIIHGDGAKVIKVGEVNATEVEDEDDIAKFKDYKPSQLGDSKEVKVPSDPSPPTPPKKEDTEPVSSAEPIKPKVANAPQSGARIFASPLARKLANDHNEALSPCQTGRNLWDQAILRHHHSPTTGILAVGSSTYGDMDQNTRDVIMGILLTESSTSSRMLITTEVVPFLLEASMSTTKPPLS
ncbi:hypothetical protein Sjap_017951 [Stephania japonica]|uniref:Uncharacterized protein n=1 Tax=Stephania japonica TaxID=461633 RepID=A0AAP0I7P2_9MAGN